MHYYHDQKLYQSFEGQFAQSGRVLEGPKACPCIHANWWSTSEAAVQWQQECYDRLYARMLALGIDAAESARIQRLVGAQGVDSTRRVHTGTVLTPYPLQMLQFIKDLEKWQMMPPQKATNVKYHNVGYGCGHNGSPACLEGWTGQDILMFRHGRWNTEGVHEPNFVGPFRGWMAIDYGNVTIQPAAQGTNTAFAVIYVPKHESLVEVLRSVGGSNMPVNTAVAALGPQRVEEGAGFVPGNGALMTL